MPEPTDENQPPRENEPPVENRQPVENEPPAQVHVPAPNVPPPTISTPIVRRPIDPTGEVFVQPDDEDLAPEDSAPRRSGLKTAGIVGVRAIVGIILLGVIGVSIGAASVLPLPRVDSSASSTIVDPVPTSAQLVCPGGLVRVASASGKGATVSSSLGTAAVVAGANPGGVTSKDFTASDAGTANTEEAPRLLTTPGSGTTTLVAGAQSQSVSTSEFTGLASAACTAATGGTWLAGGATSVGRTTLLLLANPTDVAATVALQIFGESGAVSAPGMTGIAVPAGGQSVLSLAGFAPGLVSPVVHVTSTGGQVVADLEQSTVRGLVPGGIDLVGGQAQPSTTTVIPGVQLVGTAAVQAQLGQDGFDDLATTLRVYVPGTRSVTASVSIVSESGAATGKALRVTLDPGIVTDLPLDGLSDGSYTIVVTAKSPLIASVRVSTAGSAAVGAKTDFAWMVGAPLLEQQALVSVAPNMTALMHFENPTSKQESVLLTATDGSTLTATVPSHGASSIAVTAGLTYKLTGFGTLYASVSGTTDGGITGYVVSPSQPGQTPLRIYG